MWLFVASASAQYRPPPAEVAAILDAPRPPAVQLSPDREWLLLLSRPALPPIAEVAAPIVKVAGLRIDPDTSGPARENPYTGVAVRRVDAPATDPGVPVVVPGRVRDVTFHRDARRFALTVLGEGGIELWVASVDRPEARRLLGPRLHAALGEPCAWLPGDEGLVCRVVPDDRGPAPVDDGVPDGPTVEENAGRKTPGRTWADLLRTAHDEALLEHFGRSALVQVGLDGSITPIRGPGLWDEATPSPDGRWLLVAEVVPPWSRRVPLSRFARRTEVVERASGRSVPVAALPVADDVPITFGSVRTGRRTVGWRADQPATLWWVEAQDGGDAGRLAEVRDALETWPAPFEGNPRRLWTTDTRFAGVQWGDDGLALVSDSWYPTRRTRTWQIDPSGARAAALLFDRSSQDEYGDPGTPLTAPGPHGWRVLQRTASGGIWLSGRGAAPDGVHPFLDRREPDGRTVRVWQAADPHHETLLALRSDREWLTWRQSQTEVPNVWRHRGRRVDPVTAFADWAPAFASVRKEVVTTTRADGLPLSSTVYFPPGWEPSQGPRPAVLWVYPNEFVRRSDAGQVTAAENTFQRPGGASHLFFLLQGYVVVDDPVLPIVSERDGDPPNDTYVEQLVAGAEAHVAALAARGYVDPARLVVGGHSYGAFTTANLLAHTDLFRAGIARSGAYNRTLTPWGFQGEERSLWEAPAVYAAIAPFTVADRVDEPLLLIHGADDANPGTWPVQSQRMYEALKGLGATVRWVELPAEDHGYRARESVGHTVWEMLDWAERHVAPAP